MLKKLGASDRANFSFNTDGAAGDCAHLAARLTKLHQAVRDQKGCAVDVCEFTSVCRDRRGNSLAVCSTETITKSIASNLDDVNQHR